MSKKKVQNMRGDRILMWVVFAIFVLYALSLLYPFVWLLINSFKTKKDFFYNVNGLPTNWNFTNWKNSFELSADRVSLPMMYFNSAFITVGSTLLALMSSSATAYALTKYNFKGRTAIYSFAVVMMMIVMTFIYTIAWLIICWLLIAMLILITRSIKTFFYLI